MDYVFIWLLGALVSGVLVLTFKSLQEGPAEDDRWLSYDDVIQALKGELDESPPAEASHLLHQIWAHALLAKISTRDLLRNKPEKAADSNPMDPADQALVDRLCLIPPESVASTDRLTLIGLLLGKVTWHTMSAEQRTHWREDADDLLTRASRQAAEPPTDAETGLMQHLADEIRGMDHTRLEPIHRVTATLLLTDVPRWAQLSSARRESWRQAALEVMANYPEDARDEEAQDEPQAAV